MNVMIILVITDEHSEFYDPYPFVMKLTPGSINRTLTPVFELSDCARYCRTMPDFLCLAYDVLISSDDAYTCFLARDTFETEPIPFNRDYLHFEIENTPGGFRCCL